MTAFSFEGLNPVVLALVATCFTWFMTALGAAAIFLARDISRRVLDGMLGFAAGVMVAASVWSLLLPAIEMSRGVFQPVWLPAAASFLLGGLMLRGIDLVLPHLHLGFDQDQKEGAPTRWRRSTLLVLAITLHNVPEGMAIGVAFGALASTSAEALPAAVALAVGIGIQNLPEGLAVSAALRREGLSCLRSFWYGQLSGIVEPCAAVVGAAVVFLIQPILPFALGLAAGAMIFVVVEEIIPESQSGGHTDFATMGAMLGFVGMMVLDVSFG